MARLEAALLGSHVATGAFALTATTAATVRTATATARTVAAAATTTTGITTTATAAAKGTASATTRGAGLLFFGLIHAEGATTKVHAVELLRGLDRVVGIFEVDEREPARTAGEAIRGKEDFANRPGL